MIISRTPYRVSFFGGGSDFPEWYEDHGGQVLATSINRYCYITCRHLPPFFDIKHRIVYSRVELANELEEIEHPAVRECLKLMNVEKGVEIHHDGDLPKNTGLGTSSSFAVGLLHVLHALKGEMVSQMKLAEMAIHVERDLCKENVGSQDQVSAAHGGLNRISFSRDGTIDVEPVTISKERSAELESKLMLFFTGFPRISSHIIADQKKNIPDKKEEIQALADMVDEGVRILTSGEIDDFGRLLDEAWQIKRTLSDKVTNGELDALYSAARDAGALGGKLCGAGGGGFLLLYADQRRHDEISQALKGLLRVPFGMERLGSQIIFYEES